MSVYLDFEESRKKMRKLKFQTIKQWERYRDVIKPNNIPAQPHIVYRYNGWKGYNDWLELEILLPKDEDFLMQLESRILPFTYAREYARMLNLKNSSEWRKWCKNKPIFISAAPHVIYKDKGWKGYGDWLGTNMIGNGERKFLSFPKARRFVRKLNLKNSKEWKRWCKNKPIFIPAAPQIIYKCKGWKSYGNWLGTNTISTKKRKFLPFPKAQRFVRKLNLKNKKKWIKYCSSGQKPANIPSAPYEKYVEWTNFGDWLGTNTIASKKKKFLPFKEARAFVHSLNLSNLKSWRDYSKNKQPKNIPSNPNKTYGNEWISFIDWLGM